MSGAGAPRCGGAPGCGRGGRRPANATFWANAEANKTAAMETPLIEPILPKARIDTVTVSENYSCVALSNDIGPFIRRYRAVPLAVSGPTRLTNPSPRIWRSMRWHNPGLVRRPPGFIAPCLPTIGHMVPAGPTRSKHDGFRLAHSPALSAARLAAVIRKNSTVSGWLSRNR
jgi:hypothetical protein